MIAYLFGSSIDQEYNPRWCGDLIFGDLEASAESPTPSPIPIAAPHSSAPPSDGLPAGSISRDTALV